VVFVGVVGLGLFIALASSGGFRGAMSVRFLLFFSFVLFGETLPIKVPRQGEQDEIITSTTFAYAILLTVGAAPAVLAQTTASIAADLLRRKPWWKAGFNAGQYTISLSACAGTLALLTHRVPPFSHVRANDLPAILVAGLVLVMANNLLNSTALALAQGARLWSYVREDLAFQALTEGVLVSLSPVVAVVAEHTLWLVPLLAIPLVAVYKSAHVSLENVQLVGRLERSVADLTELNRLNEYQALHDVLTGLPNRMLFRDRVQQAIRTAHREGVAAAVMIIDLDRFKDVNDTLGHHNGDLLLQQIGPRITSVLRESDSTARLGGDEFAVLLPNAADGEAAGEVAGRIQKSLEHPFTVGELMLDVEASIGIALYPHSGTDADVLLQRADLAMYVAKANREGVKLYDSRYDQYSPIRLALLGELRRAIDERQLVLHYQPKVDLRTSAVNSVEALVRWEHPARGLVQPAEFVPFAEHTTLIRPLTMYVLDAALRQCKEWRRTGIELVVSVNLSARNLLDLTLPDEVARLLESWDLPPSSLELELTESVLMAEPARALRVLTRLSAMGVGLSLDDFGTGYSSLAYLKQLPVKEIKVDRSFVMNMGDEESDAMIVRSTIDLGKNLGLRVVAEGVQSQAAWFRLTELGCDEAQGFYFSPPMPAEDLPQWIREWSSKGERPVPSPVT
jgi:diguanylate cyclase (GGDEF)-like protein